MWSVSSLSNWILLHGVGPAALWGQLEPIARMHISQPWYGHAVKCNVNRVNCKAWASKMQSMHASRCNSEALQIMHGKPRRISSHSNQQVIEIINVISSDVSPYMEYLYAGFNFYSTGEIHASTDGKQCVTSCIQIYGATVNDFYEYIIITQYQLFNAFR